MSIAVDTTELRVTAVGATVRVTPNDTNITVDNETVKVLAGQIEANVTADITEVRITAEPREVAVEVNTGVVTITNNYGADTVAVTAAENLGGHRIVTVEGYYASKDTANDKFKVLGMTTGAVVSGAEATVAVSGFVEENSWNWTVGTPVFLSTNGLLTQTVPTSGFRLIVGKPKTATILFIEISEPIVI